MLSLVVFLSAGCVGAPTGQEGPFQPTVSRAAAADAENPSVPPPERWGGEDRIELVSKPAQMSTVAAGGCDTPLGPFPVSELRRSETPGRVFPGTGHLEARMVTPVGAVGAQMGYSLDDGTITWSEPVFASEAVGEKEFRIDVGESDAEDETKLRWRFFWRHNYPVFLGEDVCFKGATLATPGILVEAVKGA